MEKQIRCPYCNKLLFIAKGQYNIQIKCGKCKNIIELQCAKIDKE